MSVKCESQTLLEPSPKVGPVLRIAPLIDPTWAPASSSLCAITCSQAVIVLALHPTVQLLHKMRFQATSDNTTPDAIWATSGGSSSSTAGVAPGGGTPATSAPNVGGNGTSGSSSASSQREPLLYIAFSQTVHVMRTTVLPVQANDGAPKWHIECIHRLSWPLPIHTITSLSPTMFCIFDHANKLSLVERPSIGRDGGGEGGGEAWKPVDSVDATTWGIAYQAHSGTMRSYHGSMTMQGGLKSRPFFFCSLNFFAYRVALIRWVKVIEKMANDNRWGDALDIFIGIYVGVYPPLLDFPSDDIERRKAVSTPSSKMILLFVDKALAEQDNLSKITEQIIDACIQFKAWNLLYKTLFERYTKAKQFQVFREAIEPFLMSGGEVAEAMTGEVYTEILQAYAPLLEAEHAIAVSSPDAADIDSGVIDCDVKPDKFPLARQVQRLVLSLALHKLDLNMSIRMLARYRLWTALIFVYTHALRDFCAVVDILVAECTRIAKIVSARGPVEMLEIPLVRKLFFFLKRTFEGKSFPVDPEEHSAMMAPEHSAVSELVRHIFRTTTPSNPCPMFMKLLKLGTRATLECLGELFATQPVISAHEFLVFLNEAWSKRPPDVVEAARLVPVPEQTTPKEVKEGSNNNNGDDDAASHVLILRAKASIWLEPKHVDTGTMLGIVWSLLDHHKAAYLQKKDKGGVELLCLRVLKTLVECGASPGLGEADRARLLDKAVKQNEWYQLASFLYEVEGNYDQAVAMQLQSWPRSSVFSYLRELKPEILADADHSEAILTKIPQLCELDFDQTFTLLTKENFSEIVGLDRVVKTLDIAPKLQKKFLESMFHPDTTSSPHRESASSAQSGADKDKRQQFYEKHVVTYVALLCRLAPSSVLAYLLDNESLPLTECLHLCLEHNITDAAAHLLEKTGDFPRMFELLISDLEADLQLLREIFEKHPPDIRAISIVKQAENKNINSSTFSPGVTHVWWSPKSEVGRCIDRVHYAHDVCARNVNLIMEEHLKCLWFGFCKLPLDALAALHKKTSTDTKEAPATGTTATEMTTLSAGTTAGSAPTTDGVTSANAPTGAATLPATGTTLAAPATTSTTTSATTIGIKTAATAKMQPEFAYAYRRSLKSILAQIMRLGLLAFLPPPLTMQHLLDTQANSELRDLKEPLGDVFQGLQFHRNLLFFAKTIAAMDLMKTFDDAYQEGKNRAAKSIEPRCEACELPFLASSPVMCFSCGHGYHKECLLDKTAACPKCTLFKWGRV